MPKSDLQHLRLSRIDEVILVEIRTKTIQGLALALELSDELARVTAQDWAKQLLVDFRRTRYLSSSGFAVLFKLVKQFTARGGRIKLCNLGPELRLGAGIIGLERVVEIYDSEAAALAAFAEPDPWPSGMPEPLGLSLSC
jgi:stage II sporulation protein AA (anti-sigma F factor antagonist)